METANEPPRAHPQILALARALARAAAKRDHYGLPDPIDNVKPMPRSNIKITVIRRPPVPDEPKKD